MVHLKPASLKLVLTRVVDAIFIQVLQDQGSCMWHHMYFLDLSQQIYMTSFGLRVGFKVRLTPLYFLNPISFPQYTRLYHLYSPQFVTITVRLLSCCV